MWGSQPRPFCQGWPIYWPKWIRPLLGKIPDWMPILWWEEEIILLFQAVKWQTSSRSSTISGYKYNWWAFKIQFTSERLHAPQQRSRRRPAIRHRMGTPRWGEKETRHQMSTPWRGEDETLHQMGLERRGGDPPSDGNTQVERTPSNQHNDLGEDITPRRDNLMMVWMTYL